MPTLAEVYAKAKYLYEQGPAHHGRKCHFGLVDVEAKERIRNPKKFRRVVFSVDEQGYTDWAAVKDKYVRLCDDHPVIAHHIMVKILGAVSDETIKGMADVT